MKNKTTGKNNLKDLNKAVHLVELSQLDCHLINLNHDAIEKDTVLKGVAELVLLSLLSLLTLSILLLLIFSILAHNI